LLISDARDDKARQAAEAFTALGETAAPAIHELEVRSQNSESPEKRFYAFLALSHIRPTAAAAMIRALANSDLASERFKMQFIGQMGTNAQLLVPTLVHNLESTNIFVVRACAEALGLLALEPDLCIPALTNRLAVADPYTLVHLATVQALAGFGPRAYPARPLLTNALSDPDPDVRRRAAYAIGVITAPQ